MKRWEIWIFVLLLVIANATLWGGGVMTSWYYYPDRVLDGDLHRLVTHPFVHVSWYHLLLDGSAFLMLYAWLRESSCVKRLAIVAGAHLGCLLGVTAVLSTGESTGYAGLSGIAHGLMAVWALEMCLLTDSELRWVGRVTLLIVVGKALYEAVSSHVLFSSMHGHLMGQPIGISHLSGILGACLAFGMCRLFSGRYSLPQQQDSRTLTA